MTRILYISGAPRSGSTLLSEILGAQPSVFNAGELSLFWRDASRGGACACGAPILGCPVWSGALDSVNETCRVGVRDYARLAQVRARIARPRVARQALKQARSGKLPDDVRLVLDATSVLLSSALDRLGAEVVVDSSKTLSGRLFHDLSEGSQVTVVHLVREAPAVVSSYLRSRGTARGNAESEPPGAELGEAIRSWNRANMAAVLAARRQRQTLRVRYENLVERPASVVADVCDLAGVAFDPATVDGSILTLPGASHAAVGNPIRREGKRRDIALDTRWSSELTRGQVRAVRLGTVPGRLALALTGGRATRSSSRP